MMQKKSIYILIKIFFLLITAAFDISNRLKFDLPIKLKSHLKSKLFWVICDY